MYMYMYMGFQCKHIEFQCIVCVCVGWLRLIGTLKSSDSFAEYSLFYRALLQKRPIILRSLLIVTTPYHLLSLSSYHSSPVCVCACVCVCVRVCVRVCLCLCASAGVLASVGEVWGEGQGGSRRRSD